MNVARAQTEAMRAVRDGAGAYHVDDVAYLVDELVELIRNRRPPSVLFIGAIDEESLFCIAAIGALTRTEVGYLGPHGESVSQSWADEGLGTVEPPLEFGRRFPSRKGVPV